jgi:hypothetical protein
MAAKAKSARCTGACTLAWDVTNQRWNVVVSTCSGAGCDCASLGPPADPHHSANGYVPCISRSGGRRARGSPVVIPVYVAPGIELLIIPAALKGSSLKSKK